MSLDLEVFGARRPDDVDPPPELAERGVVTDGPLEVDDEDLPAVVARVLLSCRWTVQITAPQSLTRSAIKDVARLARRIADASDGLVYDPQSDQVVWPRGLKRLREPVVSRDDDAAYEGAVIELEWLVARQLTATDADALMDVLERRMPEALPRRFGTYEPMQGRLERDGRGAFTALWDGQASLFWKGGKPFEWGFATIRGIWGSALTPEERYEATPVIGGHKAPEVDSVSLRFRDDVAADSRWCDALAGLFEAVARALDPFFAAAFLRYDENLEETVLMGRYWLGVPPSPLWLVWAGDPYREIVPGLPAGVTRAGERPDDWPALRANAIAWPPELVRRPGDFQDVRLAAPVIPKLV